MYAHVGRMLDGARVQLAEAQAAVVEESFTRLVRTRAALDRLDGTREWLARITAEARYRYSEARDAHEEAVAASSDRYAEGLSARGLSYDERRMRFQYANRPALRRVQDAARGLRFLEDAERYVRDTIVAVDRHRMEALTLFRAGRSITADEYAFSTEG